MRDACDIEQALKVHGKSVWRACCLYFPCSADAEDAYQETFLKYALADTTAFQSEEHRKAWLLHVAANVCKDALKRAERKNTPIDLENPRHNPAQNDPALQPASETSMALDALRALDDPPRTPLYLSLVEGYSAPEISSLLEAPVNTVYSWITRGKTLLKEALR